VSWSASNGPEVFPFSAPTASFWHNGRAAIWQGVGSLGLSRDDRILVPAYACGSEVDALAKAGLVLDFFRLLPDLRADIDHIEELARRPFRAIYLTHYFGFPQQASTILALARRHGAFLIEDNALGLYSADENGWPLGGVGDIGIFSLTKTLPVPDGGVLVVGDLGQVGIKPAQGDAPDATLVAGRMKSLVEATIANRVPVVAGILKTCITEPLIRVMKGARHNNSTPAALGSDTEDGGALDVRRATWRMSRMSTIIVSRVDHRFVAEARRSNYRILHDRIEPAARSRALMPLMPVGGCPAFFPLWAEEPVEMHQYLRSHGVESVRFWLSVHKAMRLSDFPFEHALKQHVLRLPLHQDLNAQSMQHIADLINEWNSRHSK
jgi:dTDP-4-amino-4,6-dideoxygalactose transaminase